MPRPGVANGGERARSGVPGDAEEPLSPTLPHKGGGGQKAVRKNPFSFVERAAIRRHRASEAATPPGQGPPPGARSPAAPPPARRRPSRGGRQPPPPPSARGRNPAPPSQQENDAVRPLVGCGRPQHDKRPRQRRRTRSARRPAVDRCWARGMHFSQRKNSSTCQRYRCRLLATRRHEASRRDSQISWSCRATIAARSPAASAAQVVLWCEGRAGQDYARITPAFTAAARAGASPRR